jgi:hypothetical protein
MSDKIDREVKKLFAEMEGTIDRPDLLVEAQESINEALEELDRSRTKARRTILKTIAELKSHHSTLKQCDGYQDIVATLAGLDMMLTPGFELVVRTETENLGHVMVPEEMFGLLMRIFSDLTIAD